MIRAVNTGIINLSLTVQESDVKLKREREARANLAPSLKAVPADGNAAKDANKPSGDINHQEPNVSGQESEEGKDVT